MISFCCPRRFLDNYLLQAESAIEHFLLEMCIGDFKALHVAILVVELSSFSLPRSG